MHLLLDDYKNREQLRREDRRSFRNYCNALVELLRVYLYARAIASAECESQTRTCSKVDEFLGEGLIAPFFVSAHMLVDGASDDDDLQCFGAILVREGALLAELNTFECERLVIKARAALCFHERPLRSYTRFVLLHVSASRRCHGAQTARAHTGHRAVLTQVASGAHAGPSSSPSTPTSTSGYTPPTATRSIVGCARRVRSQ